MLLSGETGSEASLALLLFIAEWPSLLFGIHQRNPPFNTASQPTFSPRLYTSAIGPSTTVRSLRETPHPRTTSKVSVVAALLALKQKGQQLQGCFWSQSSERASTFIFCYIFPYKQYATLFGPIIILFSTKRLPKSVDIIPCDCVLSYLHALLYRSTLSLYIDALSLLDLGLDALVLFFPELSRSEGSM